MLEKGSRVNYYLRETACKTGLTQIEDTSNESDSNVGGAAPTMPSICAESQRKEAEYRSFFSAPRPFKLPGHRRKLARHSSSSWIFVDWKVDKSCSDVARSTRSRVRFGQREDKIENTPGRGGGEKRCYER